MRGPSWLSEIVKYVAKDGAYASSPSATWPAAYRELRSRLKLFELFEVRGAIALDLLD